MQELDKHYLFQRYRVWIPILIGLSLSVFLLFRSLSETRFVKTQEGSGTHVWMDSNHNNFVDFWNPTEFRVQASGNYKKMGIVESLSGIHWTFYSALWLGVAIVMMALRDFAYMLRIRMLTERKLTWKSSFFVIMLWEFASAITPGVVGGSTVAMFILNKEKISLGRSTAIVVITALMDNLFFVLMVPLLLLFVLNKGVFSHQNLLDDGIRWLFWMGYAAICLVCLFLFLGVFLFPRLIAQVLGGITSLSFLLKRRRKALRVGLEVKLTAEQFKKFPFVFWLKIFGSTFLSWTARYLVINSLLMAFLSLNFYENLLVFSKQFVLWVLMLVSPTPGASGVAEWAFSKLLGDYSSSAVLIVVIAILWRMISYFPYLFIGAFILPKWLKKK